MSVTIDKTYTQTVKDSIVIKGEKDVLIECGSAKILMKSDGTVQIDASKVNVKASGDVKIKGSAVAIN
jgi:type VI secretion system secreted protein VgrG